MKCVHIDTKEMIKNQYFSIVELSELSRLLCILCWEEGTKLRGCNFSL